MLTSSQNVIQLFKQKHSLAIRIWHWVTFSLFTATIVMVLLASTLFDGRANVSMIQEQVKEKGGMVTNEQARNVAHEYNDKLWNTHKIIGFILCFALFSRVVIEVALAKEERLSAKIKMAAKLIKFNPDKIANPNHYLMVKYGYVVFYILFFIMATTGLVLAFEDVAFLKPAHNFAKSIHSLVQYLIYGYIVIHLIGVIRADVTENPGIVSGMINSGKE